jgi:hypothetical protein
LIRGVLVANPPERVQLIRWSADEAAERRTKWGYTVEHELE